MKLKLPIFQKAEEKSVRYSSPVQINPRLRFIVFPFVIAFVFLVLFVRLFQITMVKGSYYQFISQNNRLKELYIKAPRGDIIDRKGIKLTQSTVISEKNTRLYSNPFVFSHILGYIQIASKSDLKNDLCQTPLELNDTIGREGIEKIFECYLRGIKGKKLIEVNSAGKKLRTLAYIPPKQGNNLTISIDSALQNKAYEIIENNAITTSVPIDLKTKKIAIIATKPSTGEVLILMSYPSYNPEVFQNDKEAVSKLLEDEEKPLFNRALMGTYPPGSVFKPIVAVGALEEGVIDKDFTIEDTGSIKAGSKTFSNWLFLQYGRTDGVVDVIKGLRRSNDVFFYKVGEKLTSPKIKKWAFAFGLGSKTEIGLAEQEGLIPTDFWKRETVKDRWYLGDTYNLSIGQGYLLTTPIQINQAISAIANNGVLCKPKVLKLSDTGLQYPLYKDATKAECKNLNISSSTLKLVQKGMKQACQSGGTGWPFFDFRITNPGIKEQSGKIPGFTSTPPEVTGISTSSADLQPIYVACKTGTAQSHLASELPHAWFTVWAPADKPEIVLTVMVEESGEGSYIAAPIAKEILKYYFERQE